MRELPKDCQLISQEAFQERKDWHDIFKAENKINIQKSFAFYTAIMSYQKGKLRNQSHLQLN